MQDLGGIVLLNLNGLLQDDGARVTLGGDDVDGRARNLHALGQRRLVDVESVKALTAEGRNQGGMDVEDLIGKGLVDLLVDDGQEPSQHHKVNARGSHFLRQGLGIGGDAVVVLPRQHAALNARVSGSLQSIYTGLGGNDEGDLPCPQLAPLFSIDEGLEVGASARYEDGDLLAVCHIIPPWA